MERTEIIGLMGVAVVCMMSLLIGTLGRSAAAGSGAGIRTYPEKFLDGNGVERILHPVQDHKPGQEAPEIGFVLDRERDVVCYFHMHRHWYEGHPALSCVFLGPNMVLDDLP